MCAQIHGNMSTDKTIQCDENKLFARFSTFEYLFIVTKLCVFSAWCLVWLACVLIFRYEHFALLDTLSSDFTKINAVIKSIITCSATAAAPSAVRDHKHAIDAVKLRFFSRLSVGHSVPFWSDTPGFNRRGHQPSLWRLSFHILPGTLREAQRERILPTRADFTVANTRVFTT